MRIFFGIIVGVALTVGVAFISDNWSSGPLTTGSSASVTDHRSMVNWGVVGDNLRNVGHSVRETWTRLSQKVAG